MLFFYSPEGIPTSAAMNTVSYDTRAPLFTCQAVHRTTVRMARAMKIPYHLTSNEPMVKATGSMFMVIIG